MKNYYFQQLNTLDSLFNVCPRLITFDLVFPYGYIGVKTSCSFDCNSCTKSIL